MLDFCVRAAGMYFMAMLMIRLLGKRALGELGPFDFVVMTGVGHTVVSIALDQSIPFYEGIVILLTLAGLEYIMNFTALKNARLSELIIGKPKILIDNGKIIKKNLKKEMFNVDDLMQELRKKGINDVSEIDKGILEACGGFSVILKEEDQPLTCRDLGIKKNQTVIVPTMNNLSRQEVFDLNERNVPEEEVFSLAEAFASIHRKLDALEEKMKEWEET